MTQILLKSDTKTTEFGHLTSIDLELNAVILELFYLACLSFEHGPSAAKIYAFEYAGEIKSIDCENSFNALGSFENISKKSADWVLSRTLFYHDNQRRRAKADPENAKVEEKHQLAIEKKLDNLDKAHSLRRKLITDGADPDEVNRLVGGLLFDQRAKLLPGPDQTG
ncbi:hypothetical protein V4R08_09540 [Nitrobacter sp. NHB1]|uniref:hypothetical protein n=1 Tax=Nitrobacter sp. NHB1 TaxID=3119830 RepID=UPI003000D155